jgi:hypothetical protein
MYRYTTKQDKVDDALIKKNIDIDASVQQSPAQNQPSPTLAFQLDPKIEKELLRQLGAKGGDLLKLMATPLSPPDDPKPFITENLSFTRRVVFLVANLGNIGADRITRLRINLKGEQNKLRFINCDKITTQYQTVNLGTFGFTNTKSGELDASGSFGTTAGSTKDWKSTNSKGDTTGHTTAFSANSGVSVSGKVGYNNQLTASTTANQRSVALAASFHDNQVSFYQEGAPGLDLSGTITSDVTFEFVNVGTNTVMFYKFANFFDDKGKCNSGGDLTLSRNLLTSPQVNPDQEFKLDLEYEAAYRKVTNNDRYVPEGYQGIEMITGKNSKEKECLLIKGSDILPKKWGIKDNTSGRFIGIKILGTPSGLTFDNYQNAENLLIWLLKSKDFQKGLTSNKYPLMIDNDNLIPPQLKNLTIEII